jgi:peptide/nickel transport system substrate-binding protein
MAPRDPVLVPIGKVREKLDNDSPNYIFSPDLYLTLALSYDSMAGPDAQLGTDGVWQPDFTKMQPRLAVAWAEQPNGDWIVHLRPGVFSDRGNEWSAYDLDWVFRKVFSEGVMAFWRWKGVVGVEGIDVLDRYSLRFRLRAPYPTFPNWLISVSPNMVDSAAILDHVTADDPWGIDWLDHNVAGFGPYRLDQMDVDHLLFGARSEYWDGEPEAGEIDVRAWQDRVDAIAQLSERRPVVIVGTDPDETTLLMQKEELTVVRAWAGHVSIEIDFAEEPFTDRRVRRALALATPYEQVRSIGLLGLARPWRSPVKGVSQWYSSVPLPYSHDPARARVLLSQAGYSAGFTSDLYLPQQPSCERMGEIIARSWREVGVELVLRTSRNCPRAGCRRCICVQSVPTISQSQSMTLLTTMRR